MQRDFSNDSVVKNPPEMEELQETLVWSQGIPEDSLEEKMATHSHILACKIPQTEELGRLESMSSQKVWLNWATKHARTIFKIHY